LLDALNDYEGAVILITHDRSLMEMVADQLWLTAGGTIQPFDGDLEDYAKYVLDAARVAARGPRAEPPPPPPEPAPLALAPLRRRLDAAEAALARETGAAAEIDTALGDPALFARDPERAAELGRRRARLQARLDKAEAVWLAAAEDYERAVSRT
jgi:ATP-binding cassette subfamily F protein 3